MAVIVPIAAPTGNLRVALTTSTATSITTLAQSEEEAVDNVRRQIGEQARYFAAYAIDEDMANLIIKERN